MTNTFLGLDTNSPGDKRDGEYWQTARAKDVNQTFRPAASNSPDEDRTHLKPINTLAGDQGDPTGMPAGPTPQLQPDV